MLAWAIALIMLIGAGNELRQQRDETELANALAKLPKPALHSTALDLANYQAIQKKTPVFGSVGLVPSATNLTIHAKSLADYAAWRLTVDQVLLDNPGIEWKIDYICSGKCPTGEAHKAVLTADRLVIEGGR
jgi:hypothetical protein